MTGGAVLGLLARLEAAGVRLALSESGEGLRVYGEGKPRPEVMAEVRAQREALLAWLRGEEEKPEDVGQPAPLPSSPSYSDFERQTEGAEGGPVGQSPLTEEAPQRVRLPLPDWEAIAQEVGKCGSCALATPAPEWGPLMVRCSCPDAAFWPDRAPIALHVGHNCAAYRPEGQEVGEGYRSKDTGKRWGPAVRRLEGVTA